MKWSPSLVFVKVWNRFREMCFCGIKDVQWSNTRLRVLLVCSTGMYLTRSDALVDLAWNAVGAWLRVAPLRLSGRFRWWGVSGMKLVVEPSGAVGLAAVLSPQVYSSWNFLDNSIAQLLTPCLTCDMHAKPKQVSLAMWSIQSMAFPDDACLCGLMMKYVILLFADQVNAVLILKRLPNILDVWYSMSCSHGSVVCPGVADLLTCIWLLRIQPMLYVGTWIQCCKQFNANSKLKTCRNVGIVLCGGNLDLDALFKSLTRWSDTTPIQHKVLAVGHLCNDDVLGQGILRFSGARQLRIISCVHNGLPCSGWDGWEFLYSISSWKFHKEMCLLHCAIYSERLFISGWSTNVLLTLVHRYYVSPDNFFPRCSDSGVDYKQIQLFLFAPK